jgi:hypothetical protein
MQLLHRRLGIYLFATVATITMMTLPVVAADPTAGDEAAESVPQLGTRPEFARPAYQFLRFTEDWSDLAGRDRSTTGDWADLLKYVPLSDDGSIWASFGGHARMRFENWNRFAFGAPVMDNDSFTLWRVTLHSDLHVGDNIRFFAEGKTTQATDRDLPGGRRATLDVDSLDLEQLFVDVAIPIGDEIIRILFNSVL